MKTNSWKCYVFCFLFTVAHSKNRMKIETNWTKNHRKREILRETESERERACASEMQAECAQYKHQLVATRKNCLTQWKAYEKRSIIALDHN